MARDFNGSSGYLKSTLAAGQTSFSQVTYAFWFNADANGQYRGHFKDGPDGDGNGCRTEYDDAWGLVFTAIWSGDDGKWSIAKPSNNVWHHLAITYNYGATTNDPIIYLDGVSQTVTERVTPTGTGTNNFTTLEIGTRNGAGDGFLPWFDGEIAEFGKWNRILTASEIAGLGTKAFSPDHYLNGLKVYSPIIGNNSPEIELMFGSNMTVTATAAKSSHPRIIRPSPAQKRRFGAVAPIASLGNFIDAGHII